MIRRTSTLIVLLFLSLLCSTVRAQHPDFMGIPINGTIDNFQAKLAQKGIKVSPVNKYVQAGARQFEGYFANQKAQIVVFYSINSKKVYKCRVSFDDLYYSWSQVNNAFNYYKELLKEKYRNALNSDMSDEYKSDVSFTLMVVQPPVDVGSLLLGTIELDIKNYDDSVFGL